jgi:hypothetical protein
MGVFYRMGNLGVLVRDELESGAETAYLRLRYLYGSRFRSRRHGHSRQGVGVLFVRRAVPQKRDRDCAGSGYSAGLISRSLDWR